MKRNKEELKRGFTLIELLVVIAIISILAAILFPVFARARENARRASCMSNLKQVALGVMMYKQDYDERFPALRVNAKAVASQNNPYGWADALYPYTKSTQLLQCPSDSISPPNSNDSYQTQVISGQYSDYWINYWVTGKSDAAIDSPTLVVLLGDGMAVTGESSSASNGYKGSARATTTGSYSTGGTAQMSTVGCDAVGKAHFRHNTQHLGGANIAFADGHVKWMKGGGDPDFPDYVSSQIYNQCTGTSHGWPTFRIEAGDTNDGGHL